MRTKYLVVSYESDQDSFHYDVLFAKSEDAARQRIQKLRDYCNGFDVLDMPALERMTANVLAESESTAGRWITELEADSATSSDYPFRMFYECPQDGTKWTLEWECQCNDRCPTCDKEIESKDVEDINRWTKR
jgi:hypothetical protein